MASLNLYKITNEIRFLEILEQNIGMIMKERDCEHALVDPGRQKIAHGWGCNYLIGGQWTHDVMTSSAIAFSISLYVLECLRNPALSSEKRKKLNTYIEVLQKIANDFLSDVKECENGSYLHQPWMEDMEPSNHTALYICLLLVVYQLTGIRQYFIVAEKLAAYIKSTFREDENGTICWPYRGNMPNRRSIHGERYWKSTCVTYAIGLCYKSNCVFTTEDLNRLTFTVKTNLIRNGREIYDSFSRQSGVLVDQARIEYHTNKGQVFSMNRLINFVFLANIDPHVATNIRSAVRENSFYRNACNQFYELDNYCLLEGMTCFLDYKHSAFNFNFENLIFTSKTKGVPSV
jgi:hypothetical protein